MQFDHSPLGKVGECPKECQRNHGVHTMCGTIQKVSLCDPRDPPTAPPGPLGGRPHTLRSKLTPPLRNGLTNVHALCHGQGCLPPVLAPRGRGMSGCPQQVPLSSRISTPTLVTTNWLAQKQAGLWALCAARTLFPSLKESLPKRKAQRGTSPCASVARELQETFPIAVM
jgi:hypothetical protein